MPMRKTACLVAVTSLWASAPIGSAAQSITVAPTFQQSLASYDSRVEDVLRGEQRLHAWGLMIGLERPGRFWQPHLWYQRFEFRNPCQVPASVVDRVNDGWSLSVGPGLEVVDTPEVSAMILATAGITPTRDT
jgi:hypothetical protein